MSVAGSGRSPSTPSNKQRRPPTAAAASAVGLLALVAVSKHVLPQFDKPIALRHHAGLLGEPTCCTCMQAWSSVDSLRSSLPLAAPAGAGHSMLAGAGQWRAGQQVPSAIELELEASLQRRQCPPHGNRSNVSFAFLHVPKTAGESFMGNLPSPSSLDLTRRRLLSPAQQLCQLLAHTTIVCAGNFLVKILRRALPADGSGRYCQKRQDYSNHANFPCVERTGLAPQHLQLLADLKANFTTVCSGFNVHQDYGFFQALGIDHSRTLTMVALRHPVERTLSHYYFQMRIMQDNRKNFLFWPKNDSDYSGLIAFGSQQRQQANYHTYMLAGAMGCRWPGGPAPPTSDAEILERAKRNLEKFCVILITVR